MGTLYTFEDNSAQAASIKVIGVGGGGGNALNNMIEHHLRGVDFIVANTDAQAIEHSSADSKLQLGADLTRGLGAGANPQIGRDAAEAERGHLSEFFHNTDMVFITAGMGGGTGTGAAPIIAEVAKEMGVLTVAVVTKPFNFEGKRRMRQAETGIEELRKHVDTLITIPNQKLIGAVGKHTSMLEAFRKADDVLLQAVKGISELITHTGYMNVDFADVKAVMCETRGMAMMGSGTASGENRACEAAEHAISSPLLEDVDIHGAHGILVNVTGNEDMTLAPWWRRALTLSWPIGFHRYRAYRTTALFFRRLQAFNNRCLQPNRHRSHHRLKCRGLIMPMMKISWLFQPGFAARRTEAEEKKLWLHKQPVLQLSAKRGILCRWFQQTAMCLGSRIRGTAMKDSSSLQRLIGPGRWKKLYVRTHCI